MGRRYQLRMKRTTRTRIWKNQLVLGEWRTGASLHDSMDTVLKPPGVGGSGDLANRLGPYDVDTSSAIGPARMYSSSSAA